MSGIDPAERFLDDIDAGPGRCGRLLQCTADIAAHQLLWDRYVATGAPRFGEAVIRSLRAISRSALADHAGGGVYRLGTDECVQREKDVGDNARFLELLTWVWRVERCPELRRCAEGIIGWLLEEMRAPGFGFIGRADGVTRDVTISADASGLVLVALVEAGSVFERRDWLALAREVFDEIAANLEAAGEPRRDVEGARSPAADECATMSRAAIRLFEAFGKRRYLDLAESWVATWDATPRDVAEDRVADRSIAMSDALMIGVLARLHALTGTSRYAERAKRLVETLRPAITRSATTAATAIANMKTAAQLLSIKVSGDPRLPETRELMRIALDCGLPDRMVLGPGAGGAPGERPLAHISIGARRLAPIADAARLRTMLAPGRLAAFIGLDARETVDSRRMGGIP